MSDNEHSILNLSTDEKRAFSYLFSLADKDQLGVVTGENAVTFFERTKVSPGVLGEIWQIADSENRGLLTKPGFCMVLRLIGHYQAGREPSAELAFKPGPVPKFEGLQIPGIGGAAVPAGVGAVSSPIASGLPPNALQPQVSGQAPIRVPPLDPQKVQQYSGLFERSSTQNGLLDGASAKAIFERAGLPNEILGRIWNLSDREQKGALDQTEFIIAMHLLTSTKTRAMPALPNTLPPGLYEAAARRGVLPPSRQMTGQAPVARQMTGTGASPASRTQSPLARAPQVVYASPPPLSAQMSGTPWLITPADKAKFDQYFDNIDAQGQGVIAGDQAVSFFSDSRLPEETLAQIWDLSDIKSEGHLNKDEFAVAMYLIRQQRAPNAPSLPAFLPPALVPPTMRTQTQQSQSTAPAFEKTNSVPSLPKSAADDLFGLDQPASPDLQSKLPALQPQETGASATRDPFAGTSPGSPSSPTRFQPQVQQASSHFKPFMPTSAFGASLTSQSTGGSGGPSQVHPSQTVPQQQQQNSASDDLLGDNDTHAEESSKISNDATELANMSNQIGNLRTQMEQTQTKKTATQTDLEASSRQRRDLEVRLQQFRTQYEEEVRTVKDLEQQLASSKDSTAKLSSELAMLEGTYQDLQTQHQEHSNALLADQQENSGLKERISAVNMEVARLKPAVEKLKMDARQQKGMVSINKKQLASSEGEKDRLQGEKTNLEREALEREEQARDVPQEPITKSDPTANVASPAEMSSTNPFFRKASNEVPTDRSTAATAQTSTATGPTPSAFDALFGPSAAFAPSGQAHSRTGTPPATSFIGRSVPAATASVATAAAAHGMTDSIQSVSSIGEDTPSATPPLSDQTKDSPAVFEPPPPPENRQFTASHLPVVDAGLSDEPHGSETSSTRVVPPASRAGELQSPHDTLSLNAGSSTLHAPGSFAEDPKLETAAKDHVPGAFPVDPWQSTRATPDIAPAAQAGLPADSKDDFDSAFAGFGEDDTAREHSKETNDPFAPSQQSTSAGMARSEFPPIQSLEQDESESEDERKTSFDDNLTAPTSEWDQMTPQVERGMEKKNQTEAGVTGAAAAAISEQKPPAADAQQKPPEYKSNEPTHSGIGKRAQENHFPTEFRGLLPAREDPTGVLSNAAPSAAADTPKTSSEAVSGSATLESGYTGAPRNVFDDFDAFDNLAEAREADKNAADYDFGHAGEHSTEFSAAFDSPAASMTMTMTSSQQTPVPASRSLHQTESNGFADFQPTSLSSAFETGAASDSIQNTPQNVQHDWDAIFSGLDNSKNADTSLSSDPWATATSTTASSSAAAASQTLDIRTMKPGVPPRGGAITPGTEHDDPILKRLTGMGYPRKQALDALEKFDYDINRAVDHLTSN